MISSLERLYQSLRICSFSSGDIGKAPPKSEFEADKIPIAPMFSKSMLRLLYCALILDNGYFKDSILDIESKIFTPSVV